MAMLNNQMVNLHLLFALSPHDFAHGFRHLFFLLR